ncbi:MAG TPA: SgcJ/EcaC family oxidoreductase [Rudaea sp.]|nr:SgcJ/EcaC family oxidoreductase [Rudaea sp.]
MMHARLLAIGIVVAVLAGCGKSGPSAVTQSGATSDKAAVEAATTAFHEALRTNDLEKFMSYVADDVFFMPAGEPPVRGKEAMRKWMTAFLSQYQTTSLTLADREVRVADGWAVELGTYEWGLAPAAGGATAVDRGNYMQVWQQRPDKTWSFAREVYNSSVPPAATE